MAPFRCYDNSDVIATLIMKNFYLYLIQLWWQFCQMFVYGDGSLCSNLAGIDPEKLYRGTFICQDGLCCCIVWPSFLFDCFVKIWATCMNFLGKWFTAPPWPKIARTSMHEGHSTQHSKYIYHFHYQGQELDPPPMKRFWQETYRVPLASLPFFSHDDHDFKSQWNLLWTWPYASLLQLAPWTLPSDPQWNSEPP